FSKFSTVSKFQLPVIVHTSAPVCSDGCISTVSFSERRMVMASLSKAVNNRQWIAEHVITTIEVHAPACIEQAERELNDTDEQGETIELNPLITGLTNRLKTVTSRMVKKDLDVGEEIADDPQYRDQRDNLHSELRTEYISIKNILSSFYGDTILSIYGLSGETPVSLELLLTSSNNVVKLLKKNSSSGTSKKKSAAA
ncbi:MAG TPA: hypothetical protein VHO70_08835, partial [Chitinispirillaceae bacterium]|nr:hypothetical protein [Chitinispirillaceae bacterium]